MKTNLESFLATTKQRVTAVLEDILPFQDNKLLNNSSLYAAIRYVTLNGGKRFRPALVYATATALNLADYKSLDAAACAVELIHCYSLVHDDLPAMDNDDLRRGKPTCHKVFSEATAILVGDALQTLAFELLSNAKLNPLPAELRINMVQILAQAAGLHGMILGQAEDLAAENSSISLEQLQQLHQHKTGALIQAAIQLALLVKPTEDPQQNAALLQYAANIGLAFQVYDDILDITADTATLGKPAKSDQQNNKSTFPALLGLTAAQDYAHDLYHAAIDALSIFGEQATLLKELAFCFINRKY